MNYSDLYRNELGYDQGSTFQNYFRSDYGALISGELSKSWFTKLADYGKVFSANRIYNYLRFEGQGFVATKGSMTIVFNDDSQYYNEEYQSMRKWVIDPETGLEIGEIDLNTLMTVNIDRLTMIGFSYLQPLNTSFILKSVYFDSESKISRIENRMSGSPIWTTTSTGKVTINGIDYTWIIVGVAGGVLALSCAVVFVYYRRRNEKIIMMRSSQLAMQQDSSMKLTSTPSQSSLYGRGFLYLKSLFN